MEDKSLGGDSIKQFVCNMCGGIVEPERDKRKSGKDTREVQIRPWTVEVHEFERYCSKENNIFELCDKCKEDLIESLQYPPVVAKGDC